MKGRRTQSTAKRVDNAWKRCLQRRKKYPILPMDPDACDWDTIKYEAAEMHIPIKKEDVYAHRDDLRLVRSALGRVPSP